MDSSQESPVRGYARPTLARAPMPAVLGNVCSGTHQRDARNLYVPTRWATSTSEEGRATLRGRDSCRLFSRSSTSPRKLTTGPFGASLSQSTRKCRLPCALQPCCSATAVAICCPSGYFRRPRSTQMIPARSSRCSQRPQLPLSQSITRVPPVSGDPPAATSAAAPAAGAGRRPRRPRATADV